MTKWSLFRLTGRRFVFALKFDLEGPVVEGPRNLDPGPRLTP